MADPSDNATYPQAGRAGRVSRNAATHLTALMKERLLHHDVARRLLDVDPGGPLEKGDPFCFQRIVLDQSEA